MSKFTKGPWRIDESYTTMLTVASILDEPLCEVWCDIECDSFDINPSDEQIANANLIAAAPEMYEMLKLAQSLMDGDSIEDFTYQYQEIKTVLAKARGELK